MSMVFCRGCGQSIHSEAASCPKCGAPQKSSLALSRPKEHPTLAVISCVISGISFVAAMVDDLDHFDNIVGLIFLAVLGIVFGGASLIQKKPGHIPAVVGIVLSVLCLLIGVGSL